MNYALFEDEHCSGLLPLAFNQPVFDLRCGAFTARERAALLLSQPPAALYVRSFLAEVVQERTKISTNETTIPISVFLNARLLLTEPVVALLRGLYEKVTVFRWNGSIAALIVPDGQSHAVSEALMDGDIDAALAGADEREIDAQCVLYPWDIIHQNGAMLQADLRTFPLGTVADSADVNPTVAMGHRESICIGEEAEVGAGVIIDASNGPVVIDRGASVMHQSVVIGPAYIGRNSKIKIGAKIYEQTTIGPVCKAGGEIEGSILAGYANKQHDGFLGHSYLAPWTNLGADTNTSDLKNNYSSIRVTVEGVEYDTGKMFLGLIMADHSKCGINTMFNTGTTVGVACNIYGGGFPAKYIPHFSWGGADGLAEHTLDKFLQTAEKVMQRRNVPLTASERRLLEYIFNATKQQRSTK